MNGTRIARSALVGASLLALIVASATEAASRIPRHLDCKGGQQDIWLEAESLSYSVGLCLLSVDRKERDGKRSFDARGLLAPGGGFSFEGRTADDSVDVVLRRGDVVQQLILTDTTYRSIQTLPGGATLQRFIDFSEGGLLNRLDEVDAKRRGDRETGYADMPLHAIALDLLGQIAKPADRSILALLTRAPALQQAMSPFEVQALSAEEIDARLSTLSIATTMAQIDLIEVKKPSIHVGCGAFDNIDDLLAGDGSEWDGTSEGLDVRALEDCRCLEDDQAHAKVGELSVAVPGLGDVSFAGVEAFTHARCLESEPDCIKSISKGGINTSYSVNGTCQNGGTKILGIKAEGEGSAQAAQGDCLRDTDDFACIGRVSASGISFKWASICSEKENALCMKAEAKVDMEISLCTVPGQIIPAVESSGSVNGQAGGC